MRPTSHGILARLRPTPFGEFTTRIGLTDPVASGLRPLGDDPGRTAGWRRCTLDASHLAYVTSPDAVAKVLLDLVETG